MLDSKERLGCASCTTSCLASDSLSKPSCGATMANVSPMLEVPCFGVCGLDEVLLRDSEAPTKRVSFCCTDTSSLVGCNGDPSRRSGVWLCTLYLEA
ncbi:hypothetical protein E2C01_041244 [Portunus trituberculatus]|uniref:Uncharacterized protein n=1 Tax=Portunus trituberculatus TaxID=210409 RepID=A0A5B7FPW3_PORTR|nr:hypothetical protein [Portunus trituberculatus]